jgi:hypothetical protein
MATIYRVHLTPERLLDASDMLRYDGAFQVTSDPLGGKSLAIYLINYTEGRWESFGVHTVVETIDVSEKDYDYDRRRAAGFLNALRAVQTALWPLYRVRLVEGDL